MSLIGPPCLRPPLPAHLLQVDLDMAQESLQQQEQELEDAKVSSERLGKAVCGSVARTGLANQQAAHALCPQAMVTSGSQQCCWVLTPLDYACAY